MKSALFTDFYELTMMQGYFSKGYNPTVTFDMFYRRSPFNGGYAIFAGLGSLLEELNGFAFAKEDIDYLASLDMFHKDFLEFLSHFRLTLDIYSVQEGEVVFSGEPLLKVHGPLIEAQLIEGLLLNIINFQTLVATKTSRIVRASNFGTVMEFGLRRAQGLNGALAASRAAFIGGASVTSNTLAGKEFSIPVSGTMAHSWVLAFESEETAFMEYAKLYPDSSVFLIDTYDTLGSGIENALKAGAYLKTVGKSFGVRLDSGDLQYLSEKIRKRLDEAGFHDALIAVSNELNEDIVQQLISSGAPIDLWGVGTAMVTGGNDSALSGVYKLAEKELASKKVPVMKLSDNPAKTTDPGDKRLIRFFDESGSPLGDMIALMEEALPEAGDRLTLYHPQHESMHYTLDSFHSYKDMLVKVMSRGELVATLPTLQSIHASSIEALKKLDPTYTRTLNPHIYKVSLSEHLRKRKTEMMSEH